MAVVVDAASTSNATDLQQTKTWSHTASGTNRLVIVNVMWNDTNATNADISTITYDGVAMTSLHAAVRGSTAASGIDRVIRTYYLKNPPTGSKTISVTMSQAGLSFGAAAVSYANVNQTTPLGTASTTSTASSVKTITRTTTSVVGNLVHSAGCLRTADATVTQPSTSQFDFSIPSNNRYCGAATTGAASVATTYSWSTSTANQAMMAVDVKTDLVARTKTQTTRASIGISGTATQTSVAAISNIDTAAQSAIARISVSGSKTQTTRARIAVKGSKTQTSYSRIANSRTKTQTTRASIVSASISAKTQTALARISKVFTKTQTAAARIVANRSLTQYALARIAVKGSKTQTSYSRIANSRTKTQSALGRIGISGSKTQTARARISLRFPKTQTASARVSVADYLQQGASARIVQNTYTFSPPVTQGPSRYNGKVRQQIWRHYRGQLEGITVLKINGEYVQVQLPSQRQIAAAEIAYLGGYLHSVTLEEATALTAAGYDITMGVTP